MSAHITNQIVSNPAKFGLSPYPQCKTCLLSFGLAKFVNIRDVNLKKNYLFTPAPHRSVFTGRMPFLSPNQQRQSTEV